MWETPDILARQVEWTDWQTRRVAFRREGEPTGSQVALDLDHLPTTWRRKEDPISCLLEVGSPEAEPRVPELKHHRLKVHPDDLPGRPQTGRTGPEAVSSREGKLWAKGWCGNPAASRLISRDPGSPIAVEESCRVPAPSCKVQCAGVWAGQALKGTGVLSRRAGIATPGALPGRDGYQAPRGSGLVGAAFGFISVDVLKKSRRLSAFLPVSSPPRYGSRWLSQALEKSQSVPWSARIRKAK